MTPVRLNSMGLASSRAGYGLPKRYRNGLNSPQNTEDAEEATSASLTLLLRLLPKCVVMRSIDPEGAQGQSDPSGAVYRDHKLDSHTPRMRSSTWDKITAADLSRLELPAHVRCVFQKRERSELGTAIHSVVVGDDAPAIGSTPGRPGGLV